MAARREQVKRAKVTEERELEEGLREKTVQHQILKFAFAGEAKRQIHEHASIQ